MDKNDLTEEGNRKLVDILLSPFSGLTVFLRKSFAKIFQEGKHLLHNTFPRPEEPDLPKWADLWVTYRISLPVLLILVVFFCLLDRGHPIYSLEGSWFDRFYAIGVSIALFLLLTDLTRFLAGWLECRRLLRALEQLPLRRGFTDIKGFSWRPIWRLGGGPQRILAREWESWKLYSLQRDAVVLNNTINPGADVEQQMTFFAKQAGAVLRVLDQKWARETGEKRNSIVQVNCCREGEDDQETDVPPAADVQASERFVCFVYLNFILNVLLRLRIFAFSIVGIYLLLTASLTSYPFEPKLAIRSFLILLLLFILAVVATVYAQVHRDPTLSRVTNTKAGELGSDFWVRIGSFAALPTLGLLATQFPQIRGFLFSWIQPALDALTK